MADIKILDSGWLTTERTGAQEVNADRAGYTGSGVSSFTLKTPSFKFATKQTIDSSPNPQRFEDTEINTTGVENPLVTITTLVAVDDTTTGFQYNMLYQLNRLQRTKGVKLLYVTSTTDTRKTALEWLGAERAVNSKFVGTGKELSSATPLLEGYVDKVSIIDNGQKGFIIINITFRVTG